MTPITLHRATLDDLYREEGKAELIGGRIVRFMSSGDLPSTVAFNIAIRLHDYAKLASRGVAFAEGIGCQVREFPSGRETFSADASFYDGVRPKNRMRFIPGAPTLAVEVQSENDYGPTAEREMPDKRAGYFTAGTQIRLGCRSDCSSRHGVPRERPEDAEGLPRQ